MKKLPFVKMHGIGNDYIFINGIQSAPENLPKLSKLISDRHYGAGSDGLIVILPSEKADFKMRMFNSDGSEAEMCGNGIRCFAKYVYDYSLTSKTDLLIETKAGNKEVFLTVRDKSVSTVTVDMGMPIMERTQIPMIGDHGSVINETIELEDSVKFNITAVSMGNPHAVIFVEELEKFPLAKYGEMIENHPLFPHKTNVEFVKIISKNKIEQRTWERGSGETLACGTGASAALVASHLNDRTGRKATVKLRGGDLTIEWNEKNGLVYMTGPAVEVYRGEWPLA